MARSFSTAFLEVASVVWIIGICVPTSLDMAPDFGAGGSVEGQDITIGLLLPLIEPDAEDPLGCREVLASLPGSRFVGVALFGPAPKLPIDLVIEPFKGPPGCSMPVVTGPAPDKRVELAEELFL